LVSFRAFGEGTDGFAVKSEQRSPKPAFLLPENLKAYIFVIFVAEKVEALTTSCHWLFAELRPPVSPLAALVRK
jgi:hypothetical protein